jgi:hypothetical protein
MALVSSTEYHRPADRDVLAQRIGSALTLTVQQATQHYYRERLAARCPRGFEDCCAAPVTPYSIEEVIRL